MNDMTVAQYLFSAKGRLNRAKWWLFGLIAIVSTLIVIGVALMIAAPSASNVGSLSVFALGFILIFGAMELVLYFCTIIVTIKRLHDRNKSGWWFLLFYIAPSVLEAIAQADTTPGTASSGADILFVLGALALCVWGFVELGCLRGTVGTNRFGPDPLTDQTVTNSSVGGPASL